MARAINLGLWLRLNWFLPLLALLFAIELAFVRSIDWARDGFAEAVILFDLCLFVPFLYVLCYRKRLALKPLLMRAAALSCLGIYLASWLVPTEAQQLIADLGWARNAGWLVLALIELWVVVLTVKLVFGGAGTEEIAERTAAPPWIVRMMQLEARFWKAVWRFLRGR